MLLPLVLALWVLGLRGVDPAAINDWGLLPALPVTFFVAVGLLIASAALVLCESQLSPVRLGLHLVALVLVLHGTVPMLFAEPAYSWTYKHIGVVDYINLQGSLDPRIDIYQNWPAFFAPAAWLTRVAGVGSPLAFAVWTPVYFNLLICIELAFVTRALAVGSRVRWLGMFIFVAGNWVGQDYFAPQAMAFVLSLAVFGMVLTWLQVDRVSAPVRALLRRARSILRVQRSVRPAPEGAMNQPLSGWLRVAAFGATLAVFSVVVVAHQLSPYMIVLGVGLLTAAGLVRPRWFVVAMVVITFGYLLPHLPFLQRSESLFSPTAGFEALFDFLHDPLHYLEGRAGDSVGLPGRRVTSLAAPVVVLGLWVVGILGALRRLRSGRPMLLLGLLALSPALIGLGQRYGGEAILRIYLFSLPWTAMLAASAIEPRSGRWRGRDGVVTGLTLVVVVVLFMSAVFGSQGVHRIRPASIKASQAFYDHAEPDSLLVVGGPNFPVALGDRYDKFGGPHVLTSFDEFKHRLLGPRDLAAIAALAGEGGRPMYVALTEDEQTWAEVFGLLPEGSLTSLAAAFAGSADWQPVYRNAGAAIYRFPVSAAAGDTWRVASRTRAVPARPWQAPVGVGIAGLALPSLALALARRRRISSQLHVPVRLPTTAVATVTATPVQVPAWTLAHERRLTHVGSPRSDPPMKTAHRAPRQSTHSITPKQVCVSLLVGLMLGVVAVGANTSFYSDPSRRSVSAPARPPVSAPAIAGLVVEPTSKDEKTPAEEPSLADGSAAVSSPRGSRAPAPSPSNNGSSITVHEGFVEFEGEFEGDQDTDDSDSRGKRGSR